MRKIIIFLLITISQVILSGESLILSFVGDIMAHDVNYNRQPYSFIYEKIKGILQNDDLSFANLEFPVDSEKPYSNYPLFNVQPEYVQAAIDGGFDVFSLANNHITDQGALSVINTYREMEKFDNIYHSGIEEIPLLTMEPETFVKKGWKIGFLAVTTLLNSYDGSEYVNFIEHEDLEKRASFIEYIQSIALKYDLFILSVHSGVEYSTTADKEKILFYRELVRSGVDILWGHHPHVVQPWEFLSVDGNRALILPSCGNLISGQTWFIDPEDPDESRVYTGDSAIYQVNVIKKEDGIEVQEVSPYLISNYKDPEQGMIVDFLEDLTMSEEIPEKWRNYYILRLALLKKLMP